MAKSGAGRASVAKRREVSRGGKDGETHRHFRTDKDAADRYIESRLGGDHKHLSELQRDAVRFYSGTGYGRINHGLSKGKKVSRRLRDFERNAAAGIARAIRASPGLPENVVTYRGLRLPANFDPTRLKGKVLRSGAFMSTSLNRETAHKFSTGFSSEKVGVLFKIRAPKGSKAVALTYQGESEVIFNKGSGLKVRSARRGKDGTWHITADYVPKGKK